MTENCEQSQTGTGQPSATSSVSGTNSTVTQQQPQTLLVTSTTQQMETQPQSTNSSNVPNSSQASAAALVVPASSATTTLTVVQSEQQQPATATVQQTITQQQAVQQQAIQQQAIQQQTNQQQQILSSPQVQQLHQQLQQQPQIQLAQQHQHINTSIAQTQQQQSNIVSMSQLGQLGQLGQMQFIQAPNGTIQQVYPQMQNLQILPGGGLGFGGGQLPFQIQLPYSSHSSVQQGTMPITSVAGKPIVSKGVAISPMVQNIQQCTPQQAQMITQFKSQQMNQAGQMFKPIQQFNMPTSSNQILISPYGSVIPQQNQMQQQQTILPANAKLVDQKSGKPFSTGHARSFGSKMLTHRATQIQPKSPILPASSNISPQIVTNQQFKQFGGSPQIIMQNGVPIQISGQFQMPQGMQGIWATPQQNFMSHNGQQIFIRGPSQPDQMFLQTTTPQLQALSHMNSAQTLHVAQAQSSPLVTHINSYQNQPISTSISQPPQIAPAPSTPMAIKPKPMANKPVGVSSGTQTLVTPGTQKPQQAQHQQAESSTPAIVTTSSMTQKSPAQQAAKVKVVQASQSTQSTAAAKNTSNALPSISNSSPRSIGISTTTQTLQAQASANTQVHREKSSAVKTDASNQCNKISIDAETTHCNSNEKVVSSSKAAVSELGKNTTKTMIASQKNNEISTASVAIKAEPPKSAPVKRVVEKKDASTEQDIDLLASYYLQQQKLQQRQQKQQQNMQQNGQVTETVRTDSSKLPPQRAIVKPQILTHVIDGYIIQESPNPFPVNGSSNSIHEDSPLKPAIKTVLAAVPQPIAISNAPVNNVSPVRNEAVNIIPVNRVGRPPNADKTLTCEMCLKKGQKTKYWKTKHKKHFCSPNCTNKYIDAERLCLHNPVNNLNENASFSNSTANNKQCNEMSEATPAKLRKIGPNVNERVQENQVEPVRSAVVEGNGNGLTNSNEVDINDTESLNSIAGVYIPAGGKNPLKWNVQDVYDFVRNLPGCTEYADEFRSQEIDGQALMLLKEDHLMSAMQMKLGPALKICSKINALREDVQKQA